MGASIFLARLQKNENTGELLFIVVLGTQKEITDFIVLLHIAFEQSFSALNSCKCCSRSIAGAVNSTGGTNGNG